MSNNEIIDGARFKLATKYEAGDLTVDFYAINEDWNLVNDKLSTVVQSFKLKITSKDDATSFMSIRIASCVANGTIYSLPRYTGTLALATDGANPTMEGLANTDSGTNVVANRIAGRIISEFPADSSCGIYVGNAEYEELRNEFETTINDKVLQTLCFDSTTDASVGNGRMYFVIPEKFDGSDLVRVHARVITAGTTGTLDIQIRNVTDSVDMLSTKLTIDSAETGSDTAATPAVIDVTKDDVVTNDLIAIDIDAVQTTPSKGLIVTLEFQN